MLLSLLLLMKSDEHSCTHELNKKKGHMMGLSRMSRTMPFTAVF